MDINKNLWISIEDKFPKSDEFVEVLLENETIFKVQYYRRTGSGGAIFLYDDKDKWCVANEDSHVTHWHYI